MTEKPYTTATWSMETETWRHCIFTHQMKLQMNLMYTYGQPCKGERATHASTLWFTATSPKQQCVLDTERKYIYIYIIVMAYSSHMAQYALL